MIYGIYDIQDVISNAGEEGITFSAYYNGYDIYGILYEDEFRILIESFTMLRWAKI